MYFSIQTRMSAIRRAIFTSRFYSTVVITMERYRIVPDMIPVAPMNVAFVSYPSGAEVNMGNELNPFQVKDIPIVKWKSSSTAYYTLLMVDPDAKCREWKHWLVANIPAGSVVKGETICDYIGAHPKQGSGFHRYVFLVFRQLTMHRYNEPRLHNRSVNERGGFSVRTFIQKYNMGKPIAGNFFRAKYDSYVRILDKQLGLNED